MTIEPLESRIAPATFTVTSNAPLGPGTLTEAIADANASMGTDTINFNLPVMQTTITLDAISGSFVVNSPVIIDGRSQAGYVDSPLVTIERGMMSNAMVGLLFDGGSDGSQVHGLTIRNFGQTGIEVQSNNVLISGCTATGNSVGVDVSGSNVTIGGTGIAGRNVFSGNSSYGIYAGSTNNLTVQNSHIGVDRTGQINAGNGGAGIYIEGGSEFTIGGVDKNVISGNGGDGVHFVAVFGTARVQNNYIGLYADGTINAGSKNGFGNQAPGIFAYGAANFIIGTDGMTGARNFIANNDGMAIMVNTQDVYAAGTAIITGNYIGLTTDGMFLHPASNAGGIDANGPDIRIGGPGIEANLIYETAQPAIKTGPLGSVEVRGNSLFGPTAPIIDVFGDGRTANDEGDVDTAQNFPSLIGAYRDAMANYRVLGSIQGAPNTELLVELYGYDSNSYIYVGNFFVTTDNNGIAVFNQTAGGLAPYGQLAATATNPATHNTSEMSDLALVAPAIVFNVTDTLTATEGNAGATLVSFEVSMTQAPAQPVSVQLSAGPTSTATQGSDFSFSPSTLNFSPTTTTQTVTVAITGERDVEPTELINFVLSNLNGDAILLGTTKTVAITNDDTSLKVATDGKSATWKDVDGDLVTLKSTKAILDAADFTFEAKGPLGGEVLRILDLSNDGAPAKGVGLAFTAKFDKVNNVGDGSVNVGHLNAPGVDLGIVTLPGDLGRITAGDATLADGGVKVLSIGSMGAIDSSGLLSSLQGKVSAFTVRGDIINALIIADHFGTVSLGGSLRSENAVSALILASGYGNIGSVKIGGSVVSDTDSELCGIVAGGKIGTVTIGGSLRGTTANTPGRISAGSTIGKVTIAGDMEFASIGALGNTLPANAASALAIGSVSVKGRVAASSIFAGLGLGAHNPDVQIGSITVGGDWVRSIAFAGIDRGADGRFGTADDELLTPSAGLTNNPGFISKIASIAIKGQIYGSADTTGFVAQSIGKFVRGTSAYTLRPNPTPNALPLDAFSVSLDGNVFVREVI